MYKITLFEGDGIGPEITAAVKKVLASTGLDIEYEEFDLGLTAYEKTGELIPEAALESVKRNKVALKAPVTTPVGKGFRSVNVGLRKALDLYANIRPAKTLPNTMSRFEDIDLVVVRENTEGLYVGIEHKINDYAAESIKLITRPASERICRHAFEYAKQHNRKKVTCVHKANILKLSDGLFLEVFNEIKKEYPELEAEDKIVDNMCMQAVMYPEKYDVLVMPNLYGDIVSDLASGLIGGLGLLPGANIGKDVAIFEAVHGSAPDIAGLNKANPIALLLSACLMLDHLGEVNKSNQIKNAIEKTLTQGEFLTGDLGGSATTTQITDAIISNL